MPSYKGFEAKNFKNIGGLDGDGLQADMFLHGTRIGLFTYHGNGGSPVTSFDRKEDEEEVMRILYQFAKQNPDERMMALYQYDSTVYEKDLERIHQNYPYLHEELTMEVVSAFSLEYLVYELIGLTNLEMFYMEDFLTDGYRAISVSDDGHLTGYPEEWTDEQIRAAAKGDRLFLSLQDFYIE